MGLHMELLNCERICSCWSKKKTGQLIRAYPQTTSDVSIKGRSIKNLRLR